MVSDSGAMVFEWKWFPDNIYTGLQCDLRDSVCIMNLRKIDDSPHSTIVTYYLLLLK